MEAIDQCKKGVSSDVSIPSSPESPPSSSLLSNACSIKLSSHSSGQKHHVHTNFFSNFGQAILDQKEDEVQGLHKSSAVTKD